MNRALRLRLFFMMSLEFGIWGAWLPQIYNYLPFSALQKSAILNAFPIAALVAMFFSNQFADRNFAAEKFLALSQFVGGLAMLGLAFTTDFWVFFTFFLIHCLLYVPTLSIVNAIAFTHLKDPKDFGWVRMGGTVGWVLAACPFTFILVDWSKVNQAHSTGLLDRLRIALGSPLTGEALRHSQRWIFVVAGIVSLMLAAFSLTLPRTPPKKAEAAEDKFAWLEALRLLGKPFVLVLWVLAFVDTFVLYTYFNWSFLFLVSPQVGIGGNWISPIMSIGSAAELFTMAVLGVALKRFGWRLTMLLGILGHVVRFAVFAFFPHATVLIILINLVHGVCYAFFFAAVYIFVDEYFPRDARASAQGLFNVMILGLGVIVANSLCPWLLRHYTRDGVTDFRSLFSIAGGVALASAAALVLFFHPPSQKEAAPT